MADPLVTPATAATLAGAGVAIPVLTLFGVPLGLQAHILIAGLFGAIAAIVLLDSVPGSTDTLPELLRTTGKRVMVAAISAVVAGYGAPVVGPLLLDLLGVVLAPERIASLTQPLTLLGALLLGGGAQRLFKVGIDILARRGERAAGA